MFILLIIIASSVSLAIDSPLLDPESPLEAQLTLTNYVFTVRVAGAVNILEDLPEDLPDDLSDDLSDDFSDRLSDGLHDWPPHQAIFVTEALLKIIAYGFLFTERAYLKNGWNQLDFAIVLVSVTVIAAEVLDIEALAPLKSLRVLRALRPLRLVGRIESMKVIVATLIASIPAVMNVLAVYLFIQAVFAILGMQVRSPLIALDAPLTVLDCPLIASDDV